MILDHIPSDICYNRIISTVPSQTELLFDLGLDEKVVGITKFCIHPHEWHLQKTKIGGTKNLHFDTIHQLVPDLIIANKEENEKSQVEELAKSYDVWLTDVEDLSGALQMIADIGSLTGSVNQASQLAHSIRTAFDALKQKTSNKKKIKAAYCIWKQPLMVAGSDTFINDMMNYAGFINVIKENRYPVKNVAAIKRLGGEMLLLSSEPYPFKTSHKEQFESLLPDTKVELCDGEMFSWYGSRLLQAANYLNDFHERCQVLLGG